MTSREFNEKYKSYLEERFGGLEFDIPEVTEYLDNCFFEFVKVPGFKYSQIKLKFGWARFYADGLDFAMCSNVEMNINKILKELGMNPDKLTTELRK